MGNAKRIYFFSENLRNLLMDSSSDEDFLPDPERSRRKVDFPVRGKKKPPDRKRKAEEDSSKGKCFFIY